MNETTHGPALLLRMGSEMKRELLENILPFWLRYIDTENGGFIGHIGHGGRGKKKAPKGLVMHARLLWTYSAAFALFKKKEYLEAARQAYSFLTGPLKDGKSGGYWWAIDAKGRPAIKHKVVYGQAFALYGLSEYYRASGDPAALAEARDVHALIHSRARDASGGGYYEACAEDWSAPLREALSKVDMPCAKSMNTNLHVLEALTAFLNAGGECREELAACLDTYVERIVRDDGRLSLYFDDRWGPLSDHRSYGHEIESCWLVMEAAEAAYGKDIPPRLRERALGLARGCLEAAREFGGTLPNELHAGKLDPARIWWVQAESVVGFAEAFRLTGDSAYLEASGGVWRFIKEHLVDGKRGEWHWAASEKGRPRRGREKGGMWKANYHNGRACMEMMRRAGIGA